MEDRRKLVETKKMVLSAQILDNSNYLIVDYPIEEELAKSLRVMKEQIRTYRCAIAVRKKSPFLSFFNLLLQRLIETGQVQHLKEDAIRRFRHPSHEAIVLDMGPGLPTVSPLTLDNYRFIFYSLLVGWVTACVCIVFELYF